MKKTLVVAVVMLSLAPLSALADGVYKLDPSKSTLSYKVIHKFHESVGVDKKLQGAAAIKGSDAQVQIRANVADFDSGNANRDAHMKETVEEAKYPDVTLKGIVKGLAVPAKFPDVTLKGVVKGLGVPASFPGKASGTLEGQLTFHGQTNPIKIPVTIEFESADKAHATSEFDVSLDGYKVDRPSLMFVKIDDACHITADLQFAK